MSPIGPRAHPTGFYTLFMQIYGWATPSLPDGAAEIDGSVMATVSRQRARWTPDSGSRWTSSDADGVSECDKTAAASENGGAHPRVKWRTACAR